MAKVTHIPNPAFDPIWLTPAKPKGTYFYDTDLAWAIMEKECQELDMCRCAHPDGYTTVQRQGYLVCSRCQKVIVNGG